MTMNSDTVSVLEGNTFVAEHAGRLVLIVAPPHERP
jgi:hypothetical protein